MVVESDARMDAEEQLYPRRGVTLFDAFADTLANDPGKLLIAAGDTRWTYGDVGEKVEALAASLFARGIGPGDVISIQLPNWAEFMVIHLAATRLGAITNSLLPIYRAKELGYIMSFAKTRMVFIPGTYRNFDYATMHRRLKAQLPDLDGICVVGDGCPDDMIGFDDLLKPSTQPAPIREFSGNDTTALIFTSGTESKPKGVIHTHDTLIFDNQAVAGVLGLTDREIIWGVSPLGHATGLVWAIRLSVFLGATVVLQDVWDPSAAIDLIEAERCSVTTAATPFAAMLSSVPGVKERDLDCFRTFICGGAPIPSHLVTSMKETIGCDLVSLWGMSECPISCICRPGDSPERRASTDGRALPGTEMGIFDSTRTKLLPPGEEGEIATRGPHTCKGYFNDWERTAELFNDDGWLFSNDLGIMDEDGYVRVVGRIKDIINRGGLKISAGEVEDQLIRNKDIIAVAIVAVPDERLGEKACACVVPKPGAKITLADLVGPLKEIGMAAYKLPEFYAIVEGLPMTATGKVQKFKLRDALIGGEIEMLGN